VGVLKFSQLGLPQLWRPIILRTYLWLKWGLKQSCSPHWKPSNGMSHVTCTQGNWGDSWLLVVGSQIANLTPGPSFGHNLCVKCPNGSCKPILDIYVPKDFQWYKKLLNPMGSDPCNHSLKIPESIGSPSGFQFSKWEFTWECEGSFPHTLLHSREHEMWLSGFLLGPHLRKPLFWSRAQG